MNAELKRLLATTFRFHPVPRRLNVSLERAVRARFAAVLLMVVPLLHGCDSLSWGNDESGQLGDGIFGGSALLPGSSPAGKWLVLEAGWDHTCGIKADKSLWCWGFNSSGQLGQGYEDINSAVPLQVGTAKDWSDVALGARHTCGIRAGGQLWCWGRGGSGELGDGLSTTSFVPVRVGLANDWQDISLGVRFSCGIRSARDLYCWGSNTLGQLGIGDLGIASRSTPVSVDNNQWESVEAGGQHACAVLLQPSNIARCWGDNREGQVGGTPDFQPSPVNVLNSQLITFHKISAGWDATCGRIESRLLPDLASAENLVLCWGNPLLRGHDVGGLDYVGCTSSPCDINTVPRFREIDVGVEHVCGVTNGTNQAMCWGDNTLGQLGNNSTAPAIEPVAVSVSRIWSDISVGRDHSVGLAVSIPD